MDPNKVLPNYRTLIIVSFIFFSLLTYLGFDLKGYIYKEALSLLGLKQNASVKVPAPYMNDPIAPAAHIDDGDISQQGNRMFLSKSQHVEKDLNEKLPDSSLEMASTLGIGFAPSVSKLLETRGSKNAIQVISR